MPEAADPQQEILSAEIRMVAHALDKHLQLASSGKVKFSAKAHADLGGKLAAYEREGDISRPDFQWARLIHELYGRALADREGFAYLYGPKSGGEVQPDALEALIRSRRSVREFTDQPIPDATIERLIGLAAWAPNACDLQTLKYVVIKSPAAKELLRHRMHGQMGHCVIAVVADLRFYEGSMADCPAHDSGAAIQTMLLAAHCLGLGACYASDLGLNAPHYRQLLSLAAHEKITAFVWLGHYQRAPLASARRRTAEIVRYA
jgi:nitroreductase